MFSGYRAVVCGMDPVCCESSSWMEIANVEKLPRGSNQPFYQESKSYRIWHVLVETTKHKLMVFDSAPKNVTCQSSSAMAR